LNARNRPAPGELLLAESLVIGNTIDHPMIV
jgi:hypothetical protein